LRKLAVLGYVVLGALALMGLALSLAYGALATDLGRRALIGRALSSANAAIAGRIELGGFRLPERGGVELQGLRVFDPDGAVVLSVQEVKLALDLTRLRARELGVQATITAPEVLLRPASDGGWTIQQAFASREPPGPEPAPGAAEEGTTWRLRLVGLTLTGGRIQVLEPPDPDRRPEPPPALELEAISLRGNGAYEPDGAALRLDLGGRMTRPAEATLEGAVEAGLVDRVLEVRQARVSLGESRVEVVARADLSRLTGRGLVALDVDGAALHPIVRKGPKVGAVAGEVYLESDGALVTAALDVEPSGKARGRKPGSAHAAAAARLEKNRAAGFDLRVEGLDLAALLPVAPSTEIWLKAGGRVAGKGRGDLRGGASISLAPSRIGAGQLGPAEIQVTAAPGSIAVERLELKLPGGTVSGSGRHGPSGQVAGTLELRLDDLAALGRNLSAILEAELPALSGSAQISASLAGTEEAPTAKLSASGPTVGVAGVVLNALSVNVLVQGRAGTLSLQATHPQLGTEPLDLRAAGLLSEDGRFATVNELSLTYPGNKYAMAAPAKIELSGPHVELFRLVGGPQGEQQIVLTGGVETPKRATARRGPRPLQGTLEIVQLDLAGLPRGVVPDHLKLGGRLSVEAAVVGDTRTPGGTASVKLTGGSLLGVTGLELNTWVAYKGEEGRLLVEGEARTPPSTSLAIKADLPLAPARARPHTPLKANLTLRQLDLGEILRAAGSDLPADGLAEATLQIDGTVGAPTIQSTVRLTQGAWDAWQSIDLAIQVEGAGETIRATTSVTHAGARALDAEATLPLDLSELLRHPAEVLARIPQAPLTATLSVPGYPLASASGPLGLPDAAGRLRLDAQVKGSLAKPRLRAQLEGSDLQWGKFRPSGGSALGAKANIVAEQGLSLEGRVALGPREVLILDGSLELPIERLAEREALERAALSLKATVPPLDIVQAMGGSAAAPIQGELEARVEAGGSLRRPRVEANVQGRRLAISGRPLGQLAANLTSKEGRTGARLALIAAAGGTLKAEGSADLDLGLAGPRGEKLGRTPLKASLTADRLDLGFLAAAAPDTIRGSGGILGADIVVDGTLADPRPRGALRIQRGAFDIADLGGWSEVGLDATLTDDAFTLDRLEAKKGRGKLAAKGSARGLGRKTAAELEGQLTMERLELAKAGQALATVDFEAKMTGQMLPRDIKASVTIPRATVRLPRKPPRSLQSLEDRPDIVMTGPGAPKRKDKTKEAAKEQTAGGGPPPMHAAIHLLIPRQFFIKGENPAVDIELRGEINAEIDGSKIATTGTIDTVRGRVEPVAGRVFEISRGVITFTGGPPQAALIEAAATYDNPAAKVLVAVSGPVAKPQIKLSSQPPLDEAQIAMLIATGRTELKPGGGGIDPSVGELAGSVAGAAVTQVFKDVVAEKLPLDTVSVDSSQLRAGKYVTDKTYVGYTRRFNAKPEMGENTNEVQVEYQITPRWSFESKYGDAQTGGADLIWSKDY
jgi:translocation and assembly module TamB